MPLNVGHVAVNKSFRASCRKAVSYRFSDFKSSLWFAGRRDRGAIPMHLRHFSLVSRFKGASWDKGSSVSALLTDPKKPTTSFRSLKETFQDALLCIQEETLIDGKQAPDERNTLRRGLAGSIANNPLQRFV
jgi:hypothetical protein